MADRSLLAQTMAYLLCTTPDTTLGKLLNFCLAAKVEPQNSGKTALTIAEELLDQPEKMSAWIAEVIASDNDYSVAEMLALSDMELKEPAEFMDRVFQEIETVDIRELDSR